MSEYNSRIIGFTANPTPVRYEFQRIAETQRSDTE